MDSYKERLLNRRMFQETHGCLRNSLIIIVKTLALDTNGSIEPKALGTNGINGPVVLGTDSSIEPFFHDTKDSIVPVARLPVNILNLELKEAKQFEAKSGLKLNSNVILLIIIEIVEEVNARFLSQKLTMDSFKESFLNSEKELHQLIIDKESSQNCKMVQAQCIKWTSSLN